MLPLATILALSMVRASCTIPRYFSCTLRGTVVVVAFIQFCAFLTGGPTNPMRLPKLPISRRFAKRKFAISVSERFRAERRGAACVFPRGAHPGGDERRQRRLRRRDLQDAPGAAELDELGDDRIRVRREQHAVRLQHGIVRP